MATVVKPGVEIATKKGGGRNFATSTSVIATSPGLPLLFLEYMAYRKNEERNLNAWDRSFLKLDMPHT